MTPPAEVGERFEDALVLTPESIVRHAAASHDWSAQGDLLVTGRSTLLVTSEA